MKKSILKTGILVILTYFLVKTEPYKKVVTCFFKDSPFVLELKKAVILVPLSGSIFTQCLIKSVWACLHMSINVTQ